MPWLLEALSVFDWVTPVVETAKDVGYFMETGSTGRSISIDKGELSKGRRALEKAGIRVISVTTGTPFSREGMIDVSDKDFYKALGVLGNRGIDTWGY